MIPQDLGLALTPSDLTDPAISNFALNLEYLEAEYYLRATTGQGLQPQDIGSNPGPVTGGRQVAFSDPILAQFAQEIAMDEQDHVRFLRRHTTSSPLTQTCRPAIDLDGAFRAAGAAAGLGDGFDPFADETSFFLGAFLFEDVGVSAYTGAVRWVADRDLLSNLAGIQAAEGYHGGLIRSVVYQMGAQAQQAANAISRARLSLTPQVITENGLTNGYMVNIASDDANGIAFQRTPEQVLNVVFLTTSKTADHGGFFPHGVGGVVQAT